MINVMMKLGAFTFSVNTAAYDEFSRTSAFRWQGQERYGQFPAQQYTGPGEDTITLSGDIYPNYAGGLGQLNAMRFEAGKGMPLFLVDGRGFIWGKWVIKSVHESQTTFFADGVPRKQSFSLELTRYGNDA